MCSVEGKKTDDTLVRILHHAMKFSFIVNTDISCWQCNEEKSIKSSAKFSQSHMRNLLSISSFW
jgi:hypothetical protein